MQSVVLFKKNNKQTTSAISTVASVKLVSHRGNPVDCSVLAKYFGYPFKCTVAEIRSCPWINEQPSMGSGTPNHKSICSPWLQNNKIKHSLQPSEQPLSHKHKGIRSYITHIWMQHWLTNLIPLSNVFQCHLSFLSVCLSFCPRSQRWKRRTPGWRLWPSSLLWLVS